MNNIIISKELTKIPIEYFNDTIDNSYRLFNRLKRKLNDLKCLLTDLQQKNVVSMKISQELAIKKEIEEIEKKLSQRKDILIGFISVSQDMCSARLNDIERLIVTEINNLTDEELFDFGEEQEGIEGYLNKIANISSYLSGCDKGEGLEPGQC